MYKPLSIAYWSLDEKRVAINLGDGCIKWFDVEYDERGVGRIVFDGEKRVVWS